MRIIYLGTPAFAVKPLESILKSKRHTVVAVVTQPDKMNARGNKVIPPAVKTLAEASGIQVLQYNKIRLEGIEDLKKLDADIMVTCAYGQILSTEILEITKHGVINIHASLLPKYRGSSPVQWAIINGEKTVGVTIMKTALAVDSGDIILQKEMDLTGDENTTEALDKLSVIGAELILEALDGIEEGKARFVKQNDLESTHYPMLKKEDGKLDFLKKAGELINFIRGMNPWPCAFTETENGILKVYKAEEIYMENIEAEIGEVVESSPKKGLIIKCGEGFIKLLEVQGENSKAMKTEEYLRGKSIQIGSNLCRKN